MALLEQLLTDTAAQGLGYLLAVVFGVALGLMFWIFRKREADLVDKISAAKDAHLSDIKEMSKETTEAMSEMNAAHILAVKEATGAMQGLKEIANSTKQTVEYILKGKEV